MASQLHARSGDLLHIAHTLLIEKDFVVVVSNIFGLNEIGSGDALTSLELCIPNRIRHGGRGINIVSKENRQRTVIRYCSECDGIRLAASIDFSEES